MTKVSTFFTWEEVIASQTAARLGIDNSLPTQLRNSVINTAKRMDSVRALLGAPITVSSWFRCLELNAALKSKPTSQHVRGEAVDFVAPSYGSPLEICKKLLQYSSVFRYDQLILEHTWVHISFCSDPSVVPRQQVLSLLKSGGYAAGLTDSSGKLFK